MSIIWFQVYGLGIVFDTWTESAEDRADWRPMLAVKIVLVCVVINFSVPIGRWVSQEKLP